MLKNMNCVWVIIVCFACGTSNAMDYAQKERVMVFRSFALADKIKNRINNGINNGTIQSAEAVMCVLKDHFVNYLEGNGTNNDALRICNRARGRFIEDYKQYVPPACVMENVVDHVRGIFVDTHDGEPHAIYIAQGSKRNAVIFKKDDTSWRQSDIITVAGSDEIVRYVRPIKQCAESSSTLCERVAIEVEKESLKKFRLLFYTKKTARDGSTEAQWVKDAYIIESPFIICGYALSDGGKRCAMLTTYQINHRYHKHDLAILEFEDSCYKKIHQYGMHNNIKSISWIEESDLIIRSDVDGGSMYEKFNVKSGAISGVANILKKDAARNLILSSILGWRCIQEKNKITIDHQLKSIAVYLAAQAINNKEQKEASKAENPQPVVGESSLEWPKLPAWKEDAHAQIAYEPQYWNAFIGIQADGGDQKHLLGGILD